MALVALSPKVTVAIDFGTHGFFASFCDSDCPERAERVRGWKSMPDVEYKKNLSAVLLKQSDLNRDIVSGIGFDARRQFMDARHEGTENKMRFFKNFKLKLMKAGRNSFSKDTRIPSENGNSSRSLCPLVSYLVAEIVRRTLAFYRQSKGKELTVNEVSWIVTVPAIWSEQSREAMRLCCEDVIVGVPPGGVRILCEPEAASSYVLWRADEGEQLNEGDTFMCVDLGAGTFDIACYKLCSGSNLLELRHADGGLCGSVNVDNEFTSFLAELLGEDVLNTYRQEYAVDFEDTLASFQEARETVQCHDESVNVRLGLDLRHLLDDEKIDLCERCKIYSNSLKQSQDEDDIVTFSQRKGRLQIGQNLWRKFYAPVLESITTFIANILRELEDQNISTLFLVGGFSKSPFVKDKIEEEAKNWNIEVAYPVNPELAVSLGALWAVSKTRPQRRLPRTYGVAVTKPWVRGDPKERRVMDKSLGGYVIPNWFQILFWKGDFWQVGQHADFDYAIIPGTKKLKVEVYTSTEKYPMYVDNEEICSVGMTYVFHLDELEISEEELLRLQLEFDEDKISLYLHLGGRRQFLPMML